MLLHLSGLLLAIYVSFLCRCLPMFRLVMFWLEWEYCTHMLLCSRWRDPRLPPVSTGTQGRWILASVTGVPAACSAVGLGVLDLA